MSRSTKEPREVESPPEAVERKSGLRVIHRTRQRQQQVSRGLDLMLAPVDGAVGPRLRQFARIAQGFIDGKAINEIARVNRVSKRTVFARLQFLENLAKHNPKC